MSKPLRIHVVGRSGSGKTTTISYLTEHLTRLGFRVGVVKHVHQQGFTFDTKGKNTKDRTFTFEDDGLSGILT